ncbi:NADH-quinone oxidoreductase subunit A [Streptomyces sp. SBR177]
MREPTVVAAEHAAARVTDHATSHATHHATSHAADYFETYSVVGLLAVLGVLFVAVAFGAGRLLRPVVPTPEKLLTYECGVDPVGEGWAHTQVRYYVYAFLYVIFAVDSIFLFPWATVFAAPGYGATTLVEMFVFLGFLAVGLLYAYKKGVLAWL